MTTATAVIGANFGDEGKGLLTDFLASQAPSRTLVVRANGGAQAGHTVVAPGGRRHVFGHVGSGALCGAPTLLSRFFVSNPLLLDKEWPALADLAPRLLVDARSPVTTPFDMLVNQLAERARGTNRHGSCGVGFNETLERGLRPEYRLTVGDLRNQDLVRARLEAIQRTYLPARLSSLGILPEAHERELLEGSRLLGAFRESVQRFRSRVETVDDTEALAGFAHVVFEGAQGLLLDEDHPWFPHVTRSKTGLKNIVTLVREAGLERLHAVYATRWYLTRHGAGPFPTEVAGRPSPAIVDRTNLPNDWQGTLRFGLLDPDHLRETVRAGLVHASGLELEVSLGLTCLDQMGPSAEFVAGGGGPLRVNAFLAAEILAARTGLPIRFTSWGPSRTDIRIVDRDRIGWAS